MPRALLSVYDKAGLDLFAKGLADIGFELVSTGGTARHLRDMGLCVTDVSEVTGFPEIMGGRVKTLHPFVHAGLLADPSEPDHLAALAFLGITRIDVLAVNLYPFSETVAGEHTREQAVEMIDIGGPAMLRAAAKNHAGVAAIVDPTDYETVLAELQTGGVSSATRHRLMAKVFAATAAYDAAIASYFGQGFGVYYPLATELRYGENPSQRAAAYRDPSFAGASVLGAQSHGGKPLSYNNILDADAALSCCLSFAEPAAVVVKHLTPCGVAVGPEAIRRAIDADPISAFGGIVAFNRPVDKADAEALTAKNQFLEVILAPSFSAEAAEAISGRSGWGENVRVLAFGDKPYVPGPDFRSVAGGLLWQNAQPIANTFRVVTDRAPSETEWVDLRLAWHVVRYVKSNAIVLAAAGATVGVGSGQTNRVGSVRIAVRQAGDRAFDAAMASDGFFPFPDGVEEAASAGVTAVVQPGGSKKDAEVIAAANRAALAMVFTDERQFRH